MNGFGAFSVCRGMDGNRERETAAAMIHPFFMEGAGYGVLHHHFFFASKELCTVTVSSVEKSGQC